LQIAAPLAAKLIGIEWSLKTRLLYQGPPQRELVLNQPPPPTNSFKDTVKHTILNRYGYHRWHAYFYLNQCGNVYGAMVYFESVAGEVIPLVMTLRLDETGRVNPEWLCFSSPYPLYNQEILEQDKQADVLVVESEPMAEMLSDSYRGLLGSVVTTTWPGGSLTVEDVDLSPLQSRNVILMPHNSPEGFRTFYRLAKRLKQAGVKGLRIIARSGPLAEVYRPVSVIAVDDALTDDLYDAFRKHRLMSLSEFVAYADTHAGVRLEPQVQSLPVLTVGEFLERQCEEMDWVLYPIIRRGERVMIYACSGVGKTWFVIFLAECLGAGGEMLGGKWKSLINKKLLFVEGEQGEVQFKERLGCAFEPGSAKNNVKVLSAAVHGAPLPDLSTKEGQEAIEPYLSNMDVVVIDNINALAKGALGSDPESCAQFNAWINALSMRGITVIVLHHASRGGDSFGSSTKEFGLDLIIQLKRPKGYKPEQGTRFIIEFQKARNISGADIASLPVAVEHTNGRAKLVLEKPSEVEQEDLLEEVDALLRRGVKSARKVGDALGIDKNRAWRLIKEVKARAGASTDSDESANGEDDSQPAGTS